MLCPPYAIASTHFKGVLIYKECIQAVEDINEIYKGRDFAPNDDVSEESGTLNTEINNCEAEMVVQDDELEPVDISTNMSFDVAEILREPGSSQSPFPILS